MLSFETTLSNSKLSLQLTGELDIGTCHDFDSYINGVFVRHNFEGIILDFSKLTYISSAGLRSLVTFAKTAKTAEKKFAICNANGMVREVLTVSGFIKLIPIFTSVENALAEV